MAHVQIILVRRSTLKTKLIYLISESARHLFFLLTDTLCLLFHSQNRNKTKKRILIVKPDAIGDFILWLDSAKELRKLFSPDSYEILLLGSNVWAPIAERLSYFDEVWSLDKQKFISNPVYRCKMLNKIRQAGIDTVVHFIFSREFLYGDAIVRISGAENRIGFQGDCSNIGSWLKYFSDKWYTQLIPIESNCLMELERNAEFVRRLGLKEFNAGIPSLCIIDGLQSDDNKNDYYVLCPGAGLGSRQWPLSNYKDLSEIIYHETGWNGIICGGLGEEHLGDFLVRNSKTPLKNIIGKTSLEELISLIANARILIGNETGAVHIAAAVSTPSVCILGGGHFGRFIPYPVDIETNKPKPIAVFHKMDCFNCNWKCIYGIASNEVFPCLKDVSVDSVWNAVKNILGVRYQGKSSGKTYEG